MGRMNMVAQIKDPADIGMSHPSGQLDLLLEAAAGPDGRHAGGSDGLQRNPGFQLLVFHLIHFSHAALGDKSNDRVAVADGIAGQEDRAVSSTGGYGMDGGARHQDDILLPGWL